MLDRVIADAVALRGRGARSVCRLVLDCRLAPLHRLALTLLKLERTATMLAPAPASPELPECHVLEMPYDSVPYRGARELHKDSRREKNSSRNELASGL